MSRKDRILCLLVCAVFGLIGGAVSNFGFLSVRGAGTQANSGVTTAQHFVVVDSQGNRLAELGNKNGSAELNFYSGSKAHSSLNDQSLSFYDRSGAYRLGLGVFMPTTEAEVAEGGLHPALTMFNGKGKVTYEAK